MEDYKEIMSVENDLLKERILQLEKEIDAFKDKETEWIKMRKKYQKDIDKETKVVAATRVEQENRKQKIDTIELVIEDLKKDNINIQIEKYKIMDDLSEATMRNM